MPDRRFESEELRDQSPVFLTFVKEGLHPAA